MSGTLVAPPLSEKNSNSKKKTCARLCPQKVFSEYIYVYMTSVQKVKSDLQANTWKPFCGTSNEIVV